MPDGTKGAFGLWLSACTLYNQARLNARGDVGGPSARGLRPMSPTVVLGPMRYDG
jgi:hypothetical protein